MKAIIFCKIIINKNIRLSLDINDFEKNKYKNVDNIDETLRYINNSRVIKAKSRSSKTKNKKETIMRTIKTKIRFIKRNLFDFEHVETSFQVLREDDCRRERDCDNNAISTRDRVLRKKFVIATKEKIKSKNVYAKYIRETTKRRATIATIDAAIIALDKNIVIDNNDADNYKNFSESEFDIDLNMR